MVAVTVCCNQLEPQLETSTTKSGMKPPHVGFGGDFITWLGSFFQIDHLAMDWLPLFDTHGNLS
jgi:hypothetical protein